jgi:hypothetical protein
MMIVYETVRVDEDSIWDTITSIISWTSPALSLGIITLATLEVGNMVLAALVKDRYRQEGRQEILSRLPEDQRRRIEAELEGQKDRNKK